LQQLAQGDLAARVAGALPRGHGAISSSRSRPSATSRPTSTPVTDFDIDQPISGVPRVAGA
jgi:hypothetical protein